MNTTLRPKNDLRRISFFGVRTSHLRATLAAACLLAGCKSRFFSFGKSVESESSPAAPADDLNPRQLAIGQSNPSQANSTPAATSSQNSIPYAPLRGGTTKKIPLGSTVRFEVNGQQVDVTFEKILEDSRCPRDVVCVWEGLAKLQFAIHVPALSLSRSVVPTLRAGHPDLAQVSVGVVGLEVVALTPDSPPASGSGQKPASSEATVVVGNAP
ncbi:MAG: hypothetical protein RIR26_1727 [Pseudomonadota bacterium]|jgi:hypothetical protein